MGYLIMIYILIVAVFIKKKVSVGVDIQASKLSGAAARTGILVSKRYAIIEKR